MTCEEYEERIAGDLDGFADGRAAEARAHVESCARCAAARRVHGETRTLLRSRSLLEAAPPGLRTRIAARLDEDGAASSRRASSVRLGLAALAAAAAVAWLLWPASPFSAAVAAYRRALGGEVELTLRTADAGELAAYLGAHPELAVPRHVIDLAPKGFRFVGAAMVRVAARNARLVFYSDGRSVIVCDYQYARVYRGPSLPPSGPLYFSRGDLNFCVHRIGDEICVLVTRMPMGDFHARLGDA